MSEKSEFAVTVVRIGKVEKHPNADTLGITDVGGYPVIVKLGEFVEGDVAVYVPVDALVPTNKDGPFAFLAAEGVLLSRIRARRLRGVFSMGLLVKPPTGPPQSGAYLIGDDVADRLGVTKWLSPADRRAEGAATLKRGFVKRRLDRVKLPVYGLDALRKFEGLIREDEEVVVTEKIHGCNARYCFSKGRLWVGSHRVMRGCSKTALGEKLGGWWRKLTGRGSDPRVPAGDIWWEMAEKYRLREVLSKFPDMVLFGEIYGEGVQDGFAYGLRDRGFRAFDIYDMKAGGFVGRREFNNLVDSMGAFWGVPVLDQGLWVHLKKPATEWADLGGGAAHCSLLGGNIAEGIVVKPVVERVDPRLGRVALKYAGQAYLLRGEK